MKPAIVFPSSTVLREMGADRKRSNVLSLRSRGLLLIQLMTKRKIVFEQQALELPAQQECCANQCMIETWRLEIVFRTSMLRVSCSIF